MTPSKRSFLVLSAASAVAGCAAPGVGDYAAERPALDLQRYFNGRLQAWGMFSDRSGKVIKRFSVALVGRWQGDDGTLEEDFVYSDGTRQRRVWKLRKLANGGGYTGTADDVVGQANGVASGNALRWNYTLALPIDGRTWHVQMDDWMHLIDEQTMMSKTVMTKFGVKVGEITVFFIRTP